MIYASLRIIQEYIFSNILKIEKVLGLQDRKTNEEGSFDKESSVSWF
jgi:hypothetical protein